MSVPAVLLPVFVLVLLAVALFAWTSLVRVRLIGTGAVQPGDIALGERAWPPSAQRFANSFDNQFQLPLLFYVLVALALITRKTDLVFVVLSWVFVASRYAHAAIHVTSNDLRQRGLVFAAGAAVLIAMWALFALAILTAPALP